MLLSFQVLGLFLHAVDAGLPSITHTHAVLRKHRRRMRRLPGRPALPKTLIGTEFDRGRVDRCSCPCFFNFSDFSFMLSMRPITTKKKTSTYFFFLLMLVRCEFTFRLCELPSSRFRSSASLCSRSCFFSSYVLKFSEFSFMLSMRPSPKKKNTQIVCLRELFACTHGFNIV